MIAQLLLGVVAVAAWQLGRIGAGLVTRRSPLCVLGWHRWQQYAVDSQAGWVIITRRCRSCGTSCGRAA